MTPRSKTEEEKWEDGRKGGANLLGKNLGPKEQGRADH
jgi:hypothetical protein